MFNFKDIEKVNKKFASLFILNLFILITPGTTLIFILYKDLFLSLDFSKLLLLSITIICPFILINFLVIGLLSSKTIVDMNEDEAYTNFSWATIDSALILYSSVILKYFANILFKHDLNIILILIIFQVFIISLEMSAYKKPKKLN